MCDGVTWKVLAVGLTVVTSLLIRSVGGVLQAADEPASKGCVHSPTARCLIGLSLATAESSSDASLRAEALGRIAGAQVAAGEIGEARKSLSRALAAATAIDKRPTTGRCGSSILPLIVPFTIAPGPLPTSRGSSLGWGRPRKAGRCSPGLRMGDPDGTKQAFSQALTTCGEFEYHLIATRSSLPWGRGGPSGRCRGRGAGILTGLDAAGQSKTSASV